MPTAGISNTVSALQLRNIGTISPFCSGEYGSPLSKDCTSAINGLQEHVQRIDTGYAYDQVFSERGFLGIEEKYQLPQVFEYGTCSVEVSLNLYERYVDESSWFAIIGTLQEILKKCVKSPLVPTGGLFKTASLPADAFGHWKADPKPTGYFRGIICRLRRRNPEVDSSTTTLQEGTSLPRQESVEECHWRAFLNNDYSTAEIAACANAHNMAQTGSNGGFYPSAPDLQANDAEDLSDAKIVCPLALCLTNGPGQQCCPGYHCASSRIMGPEALLGVLDGVFSTTFGTCKTMAVRRGQSKATSKRPVIAAKVDTLQRRSWHTSMCEAYYGSPNPKDCRAAVLLMTSQTWTRSDYASRQAFGYPASPDVGDDMHLPRSYQIGDCVFAIHINLYEGENDHTSFRDIAASGDDLVTRCVASAIFKSGGFDRIGTLGRIVTKIYWAPRVAQGTVLVANAITTETNQDLNGGDSSTCITWVDGQGNPASSQPSCSKQSDTSGSTHYQTFADISDVPGAPDSRTEDLQQAAETCFSDFCLPRRSDCCPGYGCVEQKMPNKALVLGILESISSFAIGTCLGKVAV
ncbi:MAG: hypothetical protein M1836_008047 [Candelina mexicana]|nr:MAG: hypothetical protein M1836_008047 [Candelina mexicana]